MVTEQCKNPFKEDECTNTDVETYIVYKGERLSICKECWIKIAESDIQWSQENVSN